METMIVIMLKEKETGFLNKEIASLKINENENLIVNLFAQQEENNKIYLYIKLTTDRDVEDWEYDTIFDHYDAEIFKGIAESAVEIDNDYNPIWQIKVEYNTNINYMEDVIKNILDIHKKELIEIYDIIKSEKEN